MLLPARTTTNHKLFCAEVVYGRHIGGFVEKRWSGIRGHQTWFTGTLTAKDLIGNSFNRSSVWLRLPDIEPLFDKLVDDAYLLGLYCAEGFIGGGRSVVFCLHEDEDKLVSIVETAFPNAKTHYSKCSKAMTVSVHSSKIVPRFSECGRGCENKKVPDDILFNRNEDVVKAFLDGVFDGDGYYREDGHCSLGVTSPTLALQVSILLRRLGYPASVHFTDSFVGKDGISRRPIYTVGYNKLWEQKQRHPNIRCIEGAWYGRLKYTKKYRKLKCVVYNISVADDHTYIANGSVVGNCNDHSNHLGVDPESLLYSCWRCRASGHFSYLISKLTGIPVEYATHMLEGGLTVFKKDFESQVAELGKSKTRVRKKSTGKVTFPEGCEVIDTHTKSDLLDYYLERRNLDRQTLIDHYCLLCTYGSYKMRVIIPVFYQDKLVSWQAADMTGRADEKYLAPSPEISYIKDYIYDIDNIKDLMVITEGVLDAWRLEHDAVATFGTSITDKQKSLILKKNPKIVVFAWDGEAYDYAKEEAEEMAPYLSTVVVAHLPFNRDPDDLGYNKTWEFIEAAEVI
jgi:hypothetical protein